MTSLEDNARDTRLLNYTIEEVAIFQYPPPKKYYLVHSRYNIENGYSTTYH